MKTFIRMIGAALLVSALTGCAGGGFMPSFEMSSYSNGYPYGPGMPFGDPEYLGPSPFGFQSPFGMPSPFGFGGFGGDDDGDGD